MPKIFKSSRFGAKPGGKKFGSRPTWQRGPTGGDDRSYKPAMFSAICHECGSKCQVPFKPNGSKPILCSHCFDRNENGAPRKFDRKFESRAPIAPNTEKISEQLRSISVKLDVILKKLESVE